ncbi:hypothetical protein B0H13DRAFT_2539644 [Mycena leptocephala]|nr:hypothetical protein B0H13DRAFT_2539644 [Mycena leptocephala]
MESGYENLYPNPWTPYAWPFDPHPHDDPLPPRITNGGSLDPTTANVHRTPEHPRLRTARACERCRSRKTKCSGEHPSCSRCLAHDEPCEYPKARRTRGPSRQLKSRAGSTASSHSSQHSPASLPYPLPVKVNGNAKKRRGNKALATTDMEMSMGMGVKLEPLSSCVPLGLPSSSKVNGNVHHSYADSAYHLGTYTEDYPPSLAYTNTDTSSSSRRGSFDPPPGFAPEHQAKGYDYDHRLDYHLDPRDLDPLETGYTPDPHDRTPTVFPAVDHFGPRVGSDDLALVLGRTGGGGDTSLRSGCPSSGSTGSEGRGEGRSA